MVANNNVIVFFTGACARAFVWYLTLLNDPPIPSRARY
jgi:hypothetical protein